ncbi:uncharacterized protein LOC6582061 [Drosophila mojavensis]|uniref:inositol-phosphate phosphatase n=1 Tax=Drosophila mojavensis TaxID=7230 RepID=B4KUM2_DROMO|nr:uncharacterized protein LOC6582061 [Drosophila mojavensis]EDW18250.1 uncharacterized protein Dmoj_GI12202 [Drosophila mojavensis]
MADDKKPDPNDQSRPFRNTETAAEKPENAATSYGLEDHEATALDPRVHELKNQRSQHRRVSMPAGKTTTPKGVSATPSQHKVERVQQVPNNESVSPEKPPVDDVERVQQISVYNIPTPEKSTVEANQVPAAPVKPAEEPVGKMSPTRLQEEASRVEAAHETPQTITVYNPPPVQAVAQKCPKEKGEGVTKTCNTDITFDPSKQYASKTTNTSGLLYDNTPSQPPPPPAAPSPPPPAPIAAPAIVPFVGGSSVQKKSKQEMDEMYELAVSLVRKAGAIALSASKARPGGGNKDNTIAQTSNDIEEKITRGIKDAYPDHKIISAGVVARSPSQKVMLTNELTWVINPIDGVMNHAHGFPYYSITLALIMNKETTFGIVYNPALNEFYAARHGEGTQLNDMPIRVSGQDKLNSALVLQEYNSDMSENRTSGAMENAKRLIRKTQALRTIGSAGVGMAMVASGASDAFYFFGLHVWDMVAGSILITEAGGSVIDPAGGSIDIMSRRVLGAASKQLAMTLSVELVQDYPTPRDDESLASQPLTRDFSAQTEFSDSSDELESDGSRTTAYHNAQ